MSVTKYKKTAGGTLVKTSIEVRPYPSPDQSEDEDDPGDNTSTNDEGESSMASADDPLLCFHCRKHFLDSDKLKTHYRKYHKEFMDFNYIDNKRRIRKINRHLCKKCEKHFGDSWTLKHHQQTVHMAQRKHPCSECDKSFLSNKDMLRHLKGVHWGVKVLFPGRQRAKKEKELNKKNNKSKLAETILLTNPPFTDMTGTELVIDKSLDENQTTLSTAVAETELYEKTDSSNESADKSNSRDLAQKNVNTIIEHMSKKRIGSVLEPTFKQGNKVLGKEVQFESNEAQVGDSLNNNEQMDMDNTFVKDITNQLKEEDILVDETVEFISDDSDAKMVDGVKLESEEIIIEVIDSVDMEHKNEKNVLQEMNGITEEMDDSQVIEIQTQEGDIHQFHAFLQSTSEGHANEELEEMAVLMPDDINKDNTEQVFASALLEQNGEIRVKPNTSIEDGPIFELENLENLQFVVTEGSSEPQIVIPENGIKLTIPLSGGKENLLDMMDKLAELPDKFESLPEKFTELTEIQTAQKYSELSDKFAQQFSESNSEKLPKEAKFNELSDLSVTDQLPELPITMNNYNSNIDHIYKMKTHLDLPDLTEHDLETVGMKIGTDLNMSSETPFPDGLPLVEILHVPGGPMMEERNLDDELLDHLQGKPINVKELDENEEAAVISGTPKFISKLEFNSAENSKKYIYKKVSEESSAHLVAVKEPKNLETINLTNRSPLKHFKIDKTYKCDKCDKFFISKSFLDKHIIQAHPVFIDLQISDDIAVDIVNSEQSKNDLNLDEIENMDIDVDVVGYSDDENDIIKPMMNPVSQTVMISNIRDAPKAKRKQMQEKLQCEKCGREFFGKTAKSKLRGHIRNAHGSGFSCEECGDTFTSRHALKGHVAAVHELIKKVCPECHKAVNDLTRHIRLQHKKKDNRDHPCDYCKQAFRTDYSLKRHLEVIHFKLKKWACDLCEKLFGEKRDMLRHKTAVHFGIKTQTKVWKCPECNVSFKLRREYDQHKASNHPNLTNDQVIKFLNSELETKTISNTPKFNSNVLNY